MPTASPNDALPNGAAGVPMRDLLASCAAARAVSTPPTPPTALTAPTAHDPKTPGAAAGATPIPLIQTAAPAGTRPERERRREAA